MDLYQLYQKLYHLSQQQTQAIKEADYDQLFELIEEKQEIIDEADKINGEEYLKQQKKPAQFRARLQVLMTKTKDLESENQKLMLKAQGKLKEKMLEFNRKQKSRQGYYANSGYEAKFIDDKS